MMTTPLQTQGPYWLALDFGGTKLSAALAVADQVAAHQWLTVQRRRLPPGATAATSWAMMRALADQALAGLAPTAVGVSFGGPVDVLAGRVRRSHHVPGWDDFPLRDRAQAEWGVPAQIENDARAAALGEWCLGAGQGCESLLYVTVSTGVGGGWVVGGRLWPGADGLAGEIGHLTLQPDGPLCACGRRGCLEALAAGRAIARRARECVQADPPGGQALLALVGGHLEAVTAEHVAQAAAQGDALAGRVLSEAAQALGQGLGRALTLMNPQRVVLGGGVTKAGDRYWQRVRQTAAAAVFAGQTVDIVPAALGDNAPLWGAVVLADGAWTNR